MYFRNLLIIIIFLLISLSKSFSQKKDNPEKEIAIANYTSLIITLPEPEKKYQPAISVSGVIVYDARFDTLSSGFVEHVNYEKEKLIHFNKKASLAVKEYFQSQINLTPEGGNSTAYTLVCFIKKLFLSDNIYIDNNKQANSSDVNYEIKSGVMVLLEFYANQGENYIPLYRFDTTATGTKDIYRNGKQYLENVLTASLQRLETLSQEKIKIYHNPKNFAEINSYNSSRFNIPILKEIPRKGLYLNFESFINNTPLDTAFTVDKGKKGDFLYLKNQKGEDMLQTELWGYCDGNDIYIFSAENYFKLFRYCNTFIIYGAKGFTTTRRLRLNFGLLDVIAPNSTYAKSKTANSYSLELKLHQLDMESGELY